MSGDDDGVIREKCRAKTPPPRMVRGKTMKGCKIRNNSRTPRQRGGALHELMLLIPMAFVIYTGMTGLGASVQAKRAVEWALGEAMLVNDLGWRPSESSVGSQTRFEVRYDLKERSFNWVLPNEIPAASRNCQGGRYDIACSAWWTMVVIGRTVNSMQSPGSLSHVDIVVEFEPLPWDGVGANNVLRAYRRMKVSAKVYFDAGAVSFVSRVTGGNGLLSSRWEQRIEAIG